MKHQIVFLLVGIALLAPSRSVAQNVQLEASLTRQSLNAPGPGSIFENDIVLYPKFYVGYSITQNHRIGLTFAVISGKSAVSGDEAPTIRSIDSYPIGLEYRYLFLEDRALRPYLKGSFLIIPIKDTYESDVMPVHENTTTWGANVGGGVEWRALKYFGLFAAVNYRLVHQDEDRANYIELKGFHAQLGLTAYF